MYRSLSGISCKVSGAYVKVGCVLREMHSAGNEQGGTGGFGAEAVPDHGQVFGK